MFSVYAVLFQNSRQLAKWCFPSYYFKVIAQYIFASLTTICGPFYRSLLSLFIFVQKQSIFISIFNNSFLYSVYISPHKESRIPTYDSNIFFNNIA